MGGFHVPHGLRKAPCLRFLALMKKISIVSSCYNQEDKVGTCYETVRAICERDLPGYEREHIFIDNCSFDRRVEILVANTARDPKGTLALFFQSGCRTGSSGSWRAIQPRSTIRGAVDQW